MKHILKCSKCGAYGLGEECSCGSRRVIVGPAKYSPEDKYGRYRREAKRSLENAKENAQESE